MKQNIAIMRKDSSPYEQLLTLIRVEELRKVQIYRASAAQRDEVFASNISLADPADTPDFKRGTDSLLKHAHPTESCVTLLQVPDIRYLVDTTWNGCSAISSNKDFGELILTRWRPEEELSPWNCILLTRQEALAHDKIRDPENNVYGEAFVRSVRTKHLSARKHFEKLPLLKQQLESSYTQEKVLGNLVST